MLCVVLITSAGLRFWGLDRNPLWNDELFSWHIARLPNVASMINDGVGLDVHPPGHFMLLHGIVRFFGETEFLLRLPSAIAATLAVWAIYLLGLSLYGRREALTAAALLGVSWPGIYYAQDARPYAMLLLAVIASFIFWIDLARALAAQERPRTITIAGYSFAAIGAAYLHYFGLQIVFLQGACLTILLARKPKALLVAVAVYGGLALAYAPWVPVMADQLTNHDVFWIKRRTFLEAIRWQIFAVFHLPLWQIVTLLLPAFAAALIKIARRLTDDRSVPVSDAIVAGWCALPFLAAYVQSLVSSPVLTARNLIVILPPILLLFARGVWSINRPRISAVWCTFVVLAATYQTKSYFDEIQKDRFDQAAAYVVQQTTADVPIVAYTEQRDFFDYYFEKLRVPHRVGLVAGHSRDIPTLNNFIVGRDEFWFLAGPTAPDPNFLAYLDRNFQPVTMAEFVRASARLYRRR